MDTEPEFAPWVPKKRDPPILESTPDQQRVTKKAVLNGLSEICDKDKCKPIKKDL